MSEGNEVEAAQEVVGMRAFLQRGETRLSIMHRIAGAFISGAGLLALLPAFLGGGVGGVGEAVLEITDHEVRFVIVLSFAGIITVPILALYLLFRDLVEFYFSQYQPDWESEPQNFTPRFVLSGIGLSPDESRLETRLEIAKIQQQDSYVHFVVPKYVKDSNYLEHIARDTGDRIMPASRRDLVDPASEKPFTADDSYRKLLVAFGLAGVVDRELRAEVAKMETSLVRHAILLRSLVLR